MQVMGLVDIFRAKVVDLSDRTLTIEVKSMVCCILLIAYIVTRMLLLKQIMRSVF
jgi:acetolactate synthase small subunit